MARIGVLGGSFNPVHLGHLHMATLAESAARLDRILFLPAQAPPHKPGSELAPADHRVRMLELALEGCPRWEVETRELREGASPYTVETLDALAGDSPGDRFHFVMGWDSLRDFGSWRDPEGILSRHGVVAVDRPGVLEPPDEGYASRVLIVRGNPLGIASTDIRTRLAEGSSVRYLLPEPVLEYILRTGLYRTSTTQ